MENCKVCKNPIRSDENYIIGMHNAKLHNDCYGKRKQTGIIVGASILGFLLIITLIIVLVTTI